MQSVVHIGDLVTDVLKLWKRHYSGPKDLVTCEAVKSLIATYKLFGQTVQRIERLQKEWDDATDRIGEWSSDEAKTLYGKWQAMRHRLIELRKKAGTLLTLLLKQRTVLLSTLNGIASQSEKRMLDRIDDLTRENHRLYEHVMTDAIYSTMKKMV